jgi:hypothetical protein
MLHTYIRFLGSVPAKRAFEVVPGDRVILENSNFAKVSSVVQENDIVHLNLVDTLTHEIYTITRSKMGLIGYIVEEAKMS